MTTSEQETFQRILILVSTVVALSFVLGQASRTDSTKALTPELNQSTLGGMDENNDEDFLLGNTKDSRLHSSALSQQQALLSEYDAMLKQLEKPQ